MIALAALVAFSALVFTGSQRIDLENLAKGEKNTSRPEEYHGKQYTAFSVEGIKALIDTLSPGKGKNAGNPSSCRILWLGNSQIQYINQYQEGDHLSPYWLRSMWHDPGCLEPLGCSLPNANFQEYLILSRYAATRSAPVQLLILQLVFDKLREDGLREDFKVILTPDVAAEMRRTSPTADAVVSRFLIPNKDVGGSEEKEALSGTIQEPVEKWLNATLSRAWNLWARRSQIEGNVHLAVYYTRNYVLGIKPTTVRKMIQVRYDLNMKALGDILNDFQRRGIPVLLYIAPIRQDKPIPYDDKEYARWKQEVSELALSFGAQLVNLEQLVPGELWGTFVGADIDFMHFRGPGHRLVAEALFPHVRKILAVGGN